MVTVVAVRYRCRGRCCVATEPTMTGITTGIALCGRVHHFERLVLREERDSERERKRARERERESEGGRGGRARERERGKSNNIKESELMSVMVTKMMVRA